MAVTVLVILCLTSAVSAESRQDVSICIDETLHTELSGYLIEGTTYVPLRAFAKEMDGDIKVSWDEDSATANVIGKDVDIFAKENEIYLKANERYIGGRKNLLINGSLCVPLRSIAKSFNAEVSWDGETSTAFISKGNGVILSGEKFYDPNSLFWLSRIISAEACGEPLLGKIAVGNVVINRVKSESFPDTIKEVIFQKYKDVYQFTPVKNRSIYREPEEESILAAKLCLDGYSLSDNIQYFIRESIATSTWVCDTRTFEFAVGNHDFYS